MSQTRKKGFTIIEVMLVLAIGGLIFLMVFIALPAVQRSQRDTSRRQTAATFMSQINQYSTNNRGKVPTNQQEINRFVEDYMKQKADNTGEFLDPKTGNNVEVKYSTDTSKAPDVNGNMFYGHRVKCDGERFQSVTDARSAAILMKLEGSGVYCQDNQ